MTTGPTSWKEIHSEVALSEFQWTEHISTAVLARTCQMSVFFRVFGRYLGNPKIRISSSRPDHV